MTHMHTQPYMIALIDANSCPKSQLMNDHYKRLKQAFVQKGMRFYRFNYSNAFTRDRALELARELHIEWPLKKYDKSGQIVLINQSRQQVVACFHPYTSFEKMVQQIEHCLGQEAVSYSFALS